MAPSRATTALAHAHLARAVRAGRLFPEKAAASRSVAQAGKRGGGGQPSGHAVGGSPRARGTVRAGRRLRGRHLRRRGEDRGQPRGEGGGPRRGVHDAAEDEAIPAGRRSRPPAGNRRARHAAAACRKDRYLGGKLERMPFTALLRSPDEALVSMLPCAVPRHTGSPLSRRAARSVSCWTRYRSVVAIS